MRRDRHERRGRLAHFVSTATAGHMDVQSYSLQFMVFGGTAAVDARGDSDGVSIAAGRIVLNGGTINDDEDNPAVLV